MKITQMPPILSGSPAQQTAALRSYLVMLVRELQQVETAPVAVSAPQPGKANDIRAAARELRSLIVKTANNAKIYTDTEIGDIKRNVIDSTQSSKNYTDGKITEASGLLDQKIIDSAEQQKGYTDSRISTFSEHYVAKSEFGTYKQNAKMQMQQEAKGVIESYNYDSQINSLQSGLDFMQQFQTSIEGQIRRGIILDPETGFEVLGIAISQTLQFTGEKRDQDGETYYYLSPGQTLGLYTSTGWQFWINGVKKGWYDSLDGMLHVVSQTVEDKLYLGDKWRISTEGGFGIEYIGE